MQIVSREDNFFEMSKPIITELKSNPLFSGEKKNQIVDSENINQGPVVQS